MLILIGLLLFGLFFASLILPWVQLKRIQSVQKELHRLTKQVTWLMTQAREQGSTLPEQWDQLSDKSTFTPALTPPPDEEFTEPTTSVAAIASSEIRKEKVEKPSHKKPLSFKKIKQGIEKNFAVNLPVWIGGVALALAGAFMVKYSIEMGFLSPSVRIFMGCLFGIFLLVFGNWMHDKPQIANGRRIAQALSGAGIADLYVCLFAATSFYHLIPSFTGFVGMAVVTAVAVVLSLKQGPPIAMIGMIGGFLTPALIESSEPNAQLLFIYLYFVVAGIFTVIRRKKWWFISLPVVLATFAWVIFWLNTSYTPQDSLWLGLFLIAVSATIVVHSKNAIEEHAIDKPGTFKLFPTLNYLSMGGAILLMSEVAAKANFGEMEWGLFGFLAAGGIVLSYYKPNIYGFVPWVSGVMNVIMLLDWQESDPTILGSTLLSFALLYTISSYLLMWRAHNPLPWGLLTGISSLTYWILGYAKFHHWMGATFLITKGWYTDAHFWGLCALGLFVLSLMVVLHVLNRFQGEEREKQNLLTIFTLTATAFLSIGLTIELNEEFLTVALSAEILAVSWINGYVHIKILRPLAGALAVLFSILLGPQILYQIFLLSNILAAQTSELHYNIPNIPYVLQTKIPSVPWSFFHLGVPAFMFGLSSFWLRRQKDDVLIRGFEMTTIGLFTILTYYLTRHAFHINENLFFIGSTFVERSTFANILFLYGLACLWMGRHFERRAIFLSGGILISLSLVRILFFDLLLYNPFMSHQYVGSFPLFNALLLSFGLPILWLIFTNKQLIQPSEQKYIHYTNICLFLFLLLFISFNVRQFYHGPYLDIGATSSAEVYTYSVAWLLSGMGLLFFGTLQKNKTLRIASLAFIMLTIAKVFLYDAAELTGLLRVFSFLGLGISLLGLSWFYTRFIFKNTH